MNVMPENKGELSLSKATELINFMAGRAAANEVETSMIIAVHMAFRMFSSWSSQHSIRVGYLALNLAEGLGWSRQDAATLGLCSCLHDVGKLTIPQSILEKPSELSSEERNIIEEHAANGLSILEMMRANNQTMAHNVIKYHHENYDGSGYPDGLITKSIPDEVLIVRICDFFDAVFYDRPYRRGLSNEDTIGLMVKSEGIFKPEFLNVFIADTHKISLELV